jgi:hypothetical protein
VKISSPRPFLPPVKIQNRLNVSTIAGDGCSSERHRAKAADDSHENAFGAPSINERTSSGSSSPGNSMLSEDVSLGHSTMMTTLLVMYINILLSSRCIYLFIPNIYHISSDIIFSFLLCSAPTGCNGGFEESRALKYTK